MLRKQITAEKK